MANIVVCSAAEIDYAESLEWYAERSVDVANDFDAEFDRALTLIGDAPEQFPMCDKRHRFFLLRRFPFRIIYRFVRGGIVVVAVAHSSRSPVTGLIGSVVAQHGFYARPSGHTFVGRTRALALVQTFVIQASLASFTAVS